MRGNLGRKRPPDFKHVEKYAVSFLKTVQEVEVVMRLPRWHRSHDQASTNSCVGHGLVMERAITNARQEFLLSLIFRTKRYNPLDVWNYAKIIDPFPDTNYGDNEGTLVRSGYDAARQAGLKPVRSMKVVGGWPQPISEKATDYVAGAQTTRWATTVDEIRTVISMHQAVTIGTDWYPEFDNPYAVGDEFRVKDISPGSKSRGGHCTVLYGASDRREAFKLKNSWGGYPEIWVPYKAMDRLLGQDGEAALITDE